MTTLREIKKLAAPLIARHHDLVLIKHTVVLKPVRHILLGIMIDRTREACQFQPRWVAMSLFFKRDDISVGVGELLRHPNGLWWLTDCNVSEVLAEVVERDALPKLKTLSTIRDYANFVLPADPRERRFHAEAEVFYRLALGELDMASQVLATEERARDFWRPHLHRIGLDIGESTERLSFDTAIRARLAVMFHEWEAYTVEKLGLGAIWEKTPFPFELSNKGS